MKPEIKITRIVNPVGLNLLALRHSAGLSLERLADIANLSKDILWRMENGLKPNPTLLTMQKIARALKVSVVALVEHADDEFVTPNRDGQKPKKRGQS